MREQPIDKQPVEQITTGQAKNTLLHISDSVIEDLPRIMNDGIALLHELGPELESMEKTLIDLSERLSSGQFQLAVLGQFKRGKSTLLNALLGEDILPSSVIPLTAIPTFIRYGPERTIHIHFQDDREEENRFCDNANQMNIALLDYVSEENNPKNVKRISFVEITHPASILSDVVLIDTPGIGSTHRHNTEMTLNFLQQCDAALFVVSADPPITEVEIDFLRKVRENVARVFFVLNKIDYLTATERETATAFLRRVLNENIGMTPEDRIFSVSARQGLAANETGDHEKLTASGITDVTGYLIDFLAWEKIRVLREAVGMKVLDLLNDALLYIDLEIRSLEMPVTDLEERLKIFSEKIDEVKRESENAQDILNGDRRRIVAHLEEKCAKLRTKAQKHLESVAISALDSTGDPNTTLAADAIAQEIPIYFEHILGGFTREFDNELVSMLSRHRERASVLANSIRQAASTIFEIPYHSPMTDKALNLAREPYWVSRKSWSGMMGSLSPELLERALPKAMREKRIREKISRDIQSLVIHNVENLRWATLQNIDAAIRVFSRELENDMANTIEATHGAIAVAHARRKEHAGENSERINKLKKVSGEIRMINGMYSDPPIRE